MRSLSHTDDLRALRAAEPGMHAVVFTAYTDTHAAIVRALRDDGLVTLEFSGSTGPVKRDEAIREFQRGLDAASASVAGGGAAAEPRACVFVITTRAGNVGITLTAASRVYLMEPALDPAVEMQAAGRIHR